MSKVRYSASAPTVPRLGVWLRQLREERELPLRAVAEEGDMDLAHLHKIEQGQRLPTEEQMTRLARFFRLDQTDAQARRIAEEFRRYYADNPAAPQALQILNDLPWKTK
jgi:HTH-type transcriptional regulator, competence development regulator